MAIFLFWVGTFFIPPLPVAAQAKPVERDTFKDGKIDQIAYVDKRGNPIRLTIDSNADGIFDKTQFYQDGKFDTRYEFVDGHVARSTRDTDADEKVNVWQTYRNDLPVEQKTDGDGDGRNERVVLFDEKGQPHLSRIIPTKYLLKEESTRV